MRGMLTALALVMLSAAPVMAREAPAIMAPPEEAPAADEPVATYPDIPRDAGEYLCTPGFTLIRDTGGLRLAGDIETPTPGFSYEVTDVEEMEPGRLAGILRLTDAGGAGRTWQELLSLAEKARALNQINGKLIATSLADNQQALSTLMAAANQAALYGPDGQARPVGSGRSLGSV